MDGAWTRAQCQGYRIALEFKQEWKRTGTVGVITSSCLHHGRIGAEEDGARDVFLYCKQRHSMVDD